MAKKLPSLTDIVNSVSESEYRSAMENPLKVEKDWNDFKKSRGSGAGLTMISDMDPRKTSANRKIAKNASHSELLVSHTHQMGMSLAQATSSGSFDACAGCRTPECTKLCNATGGHMARPNSAAELAKQTRSAYWAENPQFAGALAVQQTRSGARASRELGLIPAIRSNMWSDVPWHRTTLAGPWVADFDQPGSADMGAIGLAKTHPLLTHTNYTKETMNRMLRPGEGEPEDSAPSNYTLTGSISEQTPVGRVQQRAAAGRTSQAVVWAGTKQAKPSSWTMEDSSGARGTFPAYDSDTYDARMHDESFGHGGKVGLLRHKQTKGGYHGMAATNSSFVHPLDPDAPVGSPTGIHAGYSEVKMLPVRRKLNSEQFGA